MVGKSCILYRSFVWVPYFHLPYKNYAYLGILVAPVKMEISFSLWHLCIQPLLASCCSDNIHIFARCWHSRSNTTSRVKCWASCIDAVCNITISEHLRKYQAMCPNCRASEICFFSLFWLTRGRNYSIPYLVQSFSFVRALVCWQSFVDWNSEKISYRVQCGSSSGKHILLVKLCHMGVLV